MTLEPLRATRDRTVYGLPERTLDICEIEREVEAALKKKYPTANLRPLIYDDAARRLTQARRDLQSGCAAAAQRTLPILNELLRLAGNAAWNSPAGVADLVAEKTEDVVREWLEVTRDLDELRRKAQEYKALIEEHVEDNMTKAAERQRPAR